MPPARTHAGGRRAGLVGARGWPLWDGGRDVVLEGIELLRAKDGYGDGRTIAAYASVFDVAAEIHDQHGDYREVIDPHASTASYATALITSACSTRTARIWTAAPSGLGSVPIGRPVQIKADSTGLLTLSTLNRSQLADSVLEAVKAGDLRGFSFSGRPVRSSPDRVPRTRPGAALPMVRRLQVSLTEYGPCVNPAYKTAGVIDLAAAVP